MTIDIRSVDQRVATGDLPAWDRVVHLADEAHAQARDEHAGEVADYIPQLADADAAAWDLCVASPVGRVHEVGHGTRFSIQSISKVFVYALVCESSGHERVREHVGVNNTGMPFDSVMAIETNEGHPMNPMVNAGAIATTAMMPGSDAEDQWAAIQTGMGAFAGRDLEMDQETYESEAGVNQRNQAIARLMESYGKMDRDPLATVDVYTRQCSLMVTARDLAVMGATLAAGGVNPVTGDQVVAPAVCRDVLAIMASCGMYERSGEWLFEIGLPAKSGVSGGIVAVAPGKGAVGTYSPHLDSAGTSVRGRFATAYLSRALGMDLLASDPATK